MSDEKEEKIQRLKADSTSAFYTQWKRDIELKFAAKDPTNFENWMDERPNKADLNDQEQKNYIAMGSILRDHIRTSDKTSLLPRVTGTRGWPDIPAMLKHLDETFLSQSDATDRARAEELRAKKFDPKKGKSIQKWLTYIIAEVLNVLSTGIDQKKHGLHKIGQCKIILDSFDECEETRILFVNQCTRNENHLFDYEQAETEAEKNQIMNNVAMSIPQLRDKMEEVIKRDKGRTERRLKEKYGRQERRHRNQALNVNGHDQSKPNDDEKEACLVCQSKGKKKYHRTTDCYSFKSWLRTMKDDDDETVTHRGKRKRNKIEKRQAKMAGALQTLWQERENRSNGQNHWPSSKSNRQNQAHHVREASSDSDELYRFNFLILSPSDHEKSEEESEWEENDMPDLESDNSLPNLLSDSEESVTDYSSSSNDDNDETDKAFCTFPSKNLKQRTVIDSGSHVDITTDTSRLHEKRQAKRSDDVYTATKERVKMDAVGDMTSKSWHKGEQVQMEHDDVKASSQFNANLISVGRAADKGHIVVFDDKTCLMIESEDKAEDVAEYLQGTVKLVGKRTGKGLYYLADEEQHCIEHDEEAYIYAVNPKQRRRLQNPSELHDKTHMGEKPARHVWKNAERYGFTVPPTKHPRFISTCDCDACSKTKTTAASAPSNPTRPSKKGEALSCDMTGKWTTKSRHGEQYGNTLTDDFSGRIYTEAFKKKSELTTYLKKKIAEIETQNDGRKVKRIRIDGAGENVCTEMQQWCEARGTIMKPGPANIHTDNPRAERAIRTVRNIANASRFQAKLPESYKADAWRNAGKILEKTPIYRDGEWAAPLEREGELANMSNLLPFGCIGWAHIPPEERRKDKEVAFECMVIGHTDHGYLVLDSKTKRERHVKKVTPKGKGKEEHTIQIHGDDESRRVKPTEPQEQQEQERSPPPQTKTPTRTSTRVTAKPARYHEVHHGIQEAFTILKQDIGAPRASYVASQITPEEHKKRRQEADEKEIQGLLERGTFRKEKIPPGKRALPSMMTRTIKIDRATGDIERYKSRLVLRGDKQKKNEDYFTASAKVAIFASFRLLLIIAAILELPTIWIDIDQAFCQAFMDVPTWMIPPKSTKLLTEQEIRDGWALRVVKSLYGGHQSAYLWEQQYSEDLQSIGFKRCLADECVYVLKEGDEFMITAVHVDDSLSIGHTNLMNRTVDKLKTLYKIKQRPEADQGMGMKIDRLPGHNLIITSNPVAIKQLLEKFEMQDCNIKPTPMEASTKVEEMCELENGDERQKQWPYLELLGALMFLALSCRPDILYAVSKLSQYCKTYSEEHFKALLHILKYLKGTMTLGLKLGGRARQRTDDGAYKFKHGEHELHGFADSSFCTETKGRSRTGFFTMLGGGTINYKSGRQTTPAQSTTEAEYIALAGAAREMLWTTHLIEELDIGIKTTMVPMYEDNESCLRLTQNQTSHSRAKHIETKNHLVRHCQRKGQHDYTAIPTEYQLADFLTKKLTGKEFRKHRDVIMARPEDFDDEKLQIEESSQASTIPRRSEENKDKMTKEDETILNGTSSTDPSHQRIEESVEANASTRRHK